MVNHTGASTLDRTCAVMEVSEICTPNEDLSGGVLEASKRHCREKIKEKGLALGQHGETSIQAAPRQRTKILQKLLRSHVISRLALAKSIACTVMHSP